MANHYYGAGGRLPLKLQYEKLIAFRREREMQFEDSAIETNKKFSAWNTAHQYHNWTSPSYFQRRDMQDQQQAARLKEVESLHNRREKLKKLLKSDDQMYASESQSQMQMGPTKSVSVAKSSSSKSDSNVSMSKSQQRPSTAPAQQAPAQYNEFLRPKYFYGRKKMECWIAPTVRTGSR